MKKIFTSFLCVALAGTVSFGQNIALDNPQTDVYGFADQTLIGVHFDVLNTGAQDIDVLVRVDMDEHLGGTENYFCWKFCYAPFVRESPSTDALTVPAGGANPSFIGDYNPFGNVGTTTATYTFFNAADPKGDQQVHTINYHTVMPTIVGSTTFCTGGSTTLGLENEVYTAYSWSTGETTPTITVNTAGTYTVEVTLFDSGTGNDYTRTTEVVVTESSNFAPTVSGDLNYCEGESTTLMAGPGFASYAWSNGETTQMVDLIAGTYTVTVDDGNGCNGIKMVEVVERPNPDMPVISSDINAADEVVLSGPVADQYRWIQDGFILYDEYDQEFTPEDKDPISLRVITEYGCEATSTEFTPTNVGIAELAAAGFNVYPNPAKEFVVLDYPGVQFTRGQVTLHSYTGAMVDQINLNTLGRTEINTANLKNGIYFMTVELDNQRTGVTQLVVTH